MRIEEKADNIDVSAAMLTSRIEELEREKTNLQEDLTYMKAQSMSNNLVLTNIQEENPGVTETQELTEKKLRLHLHQVMKLSKEMQRLLNLREYTECPVTQFLEKRDQ